MAMLDNENVKISDVKITSNAPFFGNRSVSGRYQKRYTGIQYFELEFTANYQNITINEVKKFVAEHQYSKAFEFPLSWFSTYDGSAKGTIQAGALIQPGGRLIKLGQFDGVLEAGTIIQFANHSKLYTVMADVEANGEMSIFPSLRGTVQSGEIINYRSPKGTFVLTNEKIEWDINSLSKLKFTATEKI